MIYETIRRDGSCIGYLFHFPLLVIVVNWVQNEQIRKNGYWAVFQCGIFIQNNGCAIFV